MAETMSLAAILDQIENIPDDLTIYVADASQLSPTTQAVALQAPADRAPPAGMRYLLEVYLAHEAIDVWSNWRGGRIPSSDDKVKAVIFCAERDAYLPVE
jgi:hypothetical protein